MKKRGALGMLEAGVREQEKLTAPHARQAEAKIIAEETKKEARPAVELQEACSRESMHARCVC
jgi:hypothetical protein